MTLAGFWTIALLTIYNASLGESQLNDPVPFPPALPTSGNVFSICSFGNSRKRYPTSFIPSSWGSHFRRRATALNRLESWYQHCCGLEAQVILCCVQQAWEQALSQFCVDEFSTKTVAYKCCRRQGMDRWICFTTDPTNPSYSPMPGYRAPDIQEGGFEFKIHECI